MASTEIVVQRQLIRCPAGSPNVLGTGPEFRQQKSQPWQQFRKFLTSGGVTHRRTKRQLEMPEIQRQTRCFSRAVDRAYSQECSTRYRIQSEAVKVDALIPSGDYYFQRLLGFLPHRCMRWGQPHARNFGQFLQSVETTRAQTGTAQVTNDTPSWGSWARLSWQLRTMNPTHIHD